MSSFAKELDDVRCREFYECVIAIKINIRVPCDFPTPPRRNESKTKKNLEIKDRKKEAMLTGCDVQSQEKTR